MALNPSGHCVQPVSFRIDTFFFGMKATGPWAAATPGPCGALTVRLVEWWSGGGRFSISFCGLLWAFSLKMFEATVNCALSCLWSRPKLVPPPTRGSFPPPPLLPALLLIRFSGCRHLLTAALHRSVPLRSSSCAQRFGFPFFLLFLQCTGAVSSRDSTHTDISRLLAVHSTWHCRLVLNISAR